MENNVNVDEREMNMANMEIDLSLINNELSPETMIDGEERLELFAPDKPY